MHARGAALPIAVGLDGLFVLGLLTIWQWLCASLAGMEKLSGMNNMHAGGNRLNARMKGRRETGAART